MLKLEEGKFCRTRDGRKVGPMLYDERYKGGWPFTCGKTSVGGVPCWKKSGCIGMTHNGNGSDLIAEWTDEETGPVRTVTRKEIVPGVYGAVIVRQDEGNMIVSICSTIHTAEEMRQTAQTLMQIADAMGEE